MVKKLSELIREIPNQYEQTVHTLYKRSPNPEKKCSVCALGGIALLSGCKVTEGGIIAEEGDCIEIGYERILELAGVPKEKAYNENGFRACIRNHNIGTFNLYNFICRMNDNGARFEEIAQNLERYDL